MSDQAQLRQIAAWNRRLEREAIALRGQVRQLRSTVIRQASEAEAAEALLATALDAAAEASRS